MSGSTLERLRQAESDNRELKELIRRVGILDYALSRLAAAMGEGVGPKGTKYHLNPNDLHEIRVFHQWWQGCPLSAREEP